MYADGRMISNTALNQLCCGVPVQHRDRLIRVFSATDQPLVYYYLNRRWGCFDLQVYTQGGQVVCLQGEWFQDGGEPMCAGTVSLWADTQEQAGRYQDLLQQHPAPILIYQDGQIVAANPAAAAACKLSHPRQLVGQQITDVLDIGTDLRLQDSERSPRATLCSSRLILDRHNPLDVEIVHFVVSWQGRPAHQIIAWISGPLTAIAATHRALANQGVAVIDQPPADLVFDPDPISDETASYVDALTGLRSRAGVIEHLSHQSDLDQDRHLLFIDLAQFRVINDSLGHEVGDTVLQEVARRICSHPEIQESMVGRLAGDEFVVMFDDLSDVQHAVQVAHDLCYAIGRPISVHSQTIGNRQLHLAASGGVAVMHPGDDPLQIVAYADVAMYAARRQGEAQIAIFDSDLLAQAQHQLQIKYDLQAALEDSDQLQVLYQPIVSPDGSVQGYEALVRWEHPEQGLIMPGDFIPAAEETGQVIQLGQIVLRKALQAAAQWQDNRFVSVNLSARQIASPRIVQTISDAISDSGIKPDRVHLEITESSVIHHPDLAIETLRRIRSLGVHLVVDDFGTGYSSLVYLDQFPLRALKIDRAFVNSMGRDGDRTTLVGAIIHLAHSMGLHVVAEGVETIQQAQALARMGADLFQGYLYGRPGPIV